MKNQKGKSGAGAKIFNFIGLSVLFLVVFSFIFSDANAQSSLPTVGISASPADICAGQTVELNWDSTNSPSVYIDNGIGYVNQSGRRNVSPTQTTTYTATASNGEVDAHASVMVVVTGPCQSTPPPTPQPTVTISANPSSVNYGGSSIVTWSSSNATSCTASSGSNGWSGQRNLSGSFHTGDLTQTTTYVITCSNSVGSDTAQTTVTVGNQVITPQPNVTISANPSHVNYNGSSIISWSSSNATSCTASSGSNGWAGSRSLSGSFNTGGLTQATTYVITCSNSVGSDTAQTTVTVGNQNVNPPPIQQPSVFTQSASNITTNSATLNGVVNGNGSNVTAWFQWGTSPSNLFNSTSPQSYGSGSTTYSAPIFGLQPNTTYYFRAVAQGNQGGGIIYGNVLSFTTLGNFNPIYPPIQPPIIQQPFVSLTADSTNLPFNGTTTLRWITSNATSCNATGGSPGWPGPKSIGPASFFTGNLITGVRTYTLTCTNGYGTASDSVVITVRGQTVVVPGTPVPRAPAASLVVITSAIDRNQPILPTIDNTMPRPGDEINYTVTYQNIGTGTITNLRLQINLPQQVAYMFSNPPNPSRFGNTLMFELGSLRANQQGTVTVRVKVLDNIPPGTSLDFPATLSYVDPGGFPQSVSANVSAEVYSSDTDEIDEEENNFLLGANVFGTGFLPDSIFGWLLLIILILLLVGLAKYLFSGNPNRYILAPANPPQSPPQHNTIIH
jgi:uncharacterized repeat protein (TIGR01451 family)